MKKFLSLCLVALLFLYTTGSALALDTIDIQSDATNLTFILKEPYLSQCDNVGNVLILVYNPDNELQPTVGSGCGSSGTLMDNQPIPWADINALDRAGIWHIVVEQEDDPPIYDVFNPGHSNIQWLQDCTTCTNNEQILQQVDILSNSMYPEASQMIISQNQEIASAQANLIAGIAGGVTSNFVTVLEVGGAIMIGILIVFFTITVMKRTIR